MAQSRHRFADPSWLLALALLPAAGCGGGGGGGSGGGTVGVASTGIQGTVIASSGIVFKANAETLPDARQAVIAAGYVAVPGALLAVAGTTQTTTTDTNGYFSITLPAGSHILIVRKQAANGTVYAYLKAYIVIDGQVLDAGQMEITATGSIQGRVTLNNGADPTGTLVYIPGTSYQARADAQGAYTLTEVPAGTYELRFEQTGYVAGSLPGVSVAAGAAVTAVAMTLNVSTGTSGSVTLNNGNAYSTSRTVGVTLAASANATVMQLSESIGFTGAAWAPVATTATWSFTSDGPHQLYVKFADANGLESASVSDSIIVDTVPPTGGSVVIDGGAAVTNLTTVTLALAAADATTSVAQMQIGNDAALTGSAWEPYAAARTWTLSAGEGTKTVYVKFMDAAGNETAQAVSDAIDYVFADPPDVLSVTAPPGTLGGCVTVTYTVQQDASLPVDVTVEYAPDAAAAFAPATRSSASEAITGVTTSPAGTAHTFVWNSTRDVPQADTTAARIRVTASYRGVVGQPMTLGNLTVRNTLFFAAATEYASGRGPYALAVGDLNGDGKPDLAVANYFGVISIFPGVGDGSFGARTDLATAGSPLAVAIGDLNGDGKPDLAATISTGLAAPVDNVSVFVGAGNGTFGPPTEFPTLQNPRSLAANDLNGDGRLDLAVASIDTAAVSIFLGTGSGSFGPRADFATASGPSSVAIEDLNRDGKPDLAVACQSANRVSVLLGTGNGAFGAKTDFVTGATPSSVAISELNGDGNPDLVVTNLNSRSVSVLLGTGSGVFGAKTDYAVGLNPESLAVADMNRDGRTDLAVGDTSGIDAWVLLQDAAAPGTFGGAMNLGAGTTPRAVGVGDFDVDGRPDVAVASYNSSSVSILLNTQSDRCDPGFAPAQEISTGVVTVAGLETGDVDGDGRPDLVVSDRYSSNVSVLQGTGNGGFAAGPAFPAGLNLRSLAIDDMNGDGSLDLAVANFSANAASVLLGTGDGNFGARTDFVAGSNPSAVALGDLNGDGRSDLVAVNWGTVADGTISVLPGAGDGSFGAAAAFAVGDFPEALALGDLNGDGKLDVAVVGDSSNAVSVLLGTGDGRFGLRSDFPTDPYPTEVSISDVDQDGKPDLAVACGDFSLPFSVSVLRGRGDGTFTPPASVTVLTSAESIQSSGTVLSLAVGDVNGDVRPDIAVTDASHEIVSVFWGQGNGGFGPKRNYPVSGIHGPLRIGDLNGDGRTDLVSGGPGGNVVVLFGN